MVLSSAVLLGAIMMAQTSTTSLASLVYPLTDVPLSVEQVEERTKKLPDGHSQTRILESRIYRDDAGRIRGETDISTKEGVRTVLVQIADPVAGFIVLLETQTMIAHRMMAPKNNLSSFGGFGVARGGVAMPGKNRKIEKLGHRMIEAIDCEGTRTTVMSDDQRSVIAVDERWVSRELGLTVLVEATGLDEHYSARIQNVIRKNPDHGLFIIPPNYTIQDAENSDPH